jgi:hypothetical protein
VKLKFTKFGKFSGAYQREFYRVAILVVPHKDRKNPSSSITGELVIVGVQRIGEKNFGNLGIKIGN